MINQNAILNHMENIGLNGGSGEKKQNKRRKVEINAVR